MAETSAADSSEAADPGIDVGGRLGDAVGSASRIVQQAATVLEEEVAAGILAARRVEERMVDVDQLRAGNGERVMPRFRRDAHDIVDLAIDLVDVALGQLRRAAGSMVTLSQERSTVQRLGADASAVPILAMAEPVPPGEAGVVSMSVDNGGTTVMEGLRFTSSELLGPNGERIAADRLSFDPDPIAVDPQERSSVAVTLNVPRRKAHGSYAGLIQAIGLPHVRAVLVVEVGAQSNDEPASVQH